MRKIFFTLLSLIFLTACSSKPEEVSARLIEVGTGFSSTSVNTTVFRNSSVATLGQTQFIAYYDAEGFVTLGKRNLADEKFETKRTQYQGNVNDAHNVISLMVDGDGYLHLSFDHHGHPLKYCRSLEPFSMTLGELEPMLGNDEQDVTYPEFYRLADGGLLFAYRSGASGRGNLVLNRYDLKSRSWQRVQDILIDGENQRNAYWQLYVDAKGTIHVSWVWRETWMVETNHDLCYACSKDNGKTWQKSDGTRYELPITKDNAEYACRIPQESELINQTSMSTDAEGHPFIATYWREQNDSIPQYRMVWHDGEQWHQQQISHRKTPFSLKGGGTKMIPIARPRMAVAGSTAYYIIRDEELGSLVSMYYTHDLHSGQWQLCHLTDFAVHAWEPSIDTELWKLHNKLHIFVQDTYQGDGETTVASEASAVYVLEVNQ
ncbi:MAG: BNR repeat-containing protein [Bacteroidales bacterium]|nr:BNR repeat-containing protein [Bacteroidales bacterium]